MRKVILFILLAILLAGCSATRKRSITPVTDESVIFADKFYDDLKETNLSSKGFYISRADIDVNTPSLEIKLIGTVKFRFPDSLFISLRTRTGIEAGRLLLTDDTVLVNDRINRQVHYGDPDDLERKFNISASAIFAVFGDFIGQPAFNVSQIKCIDGMHLCETMSGGYTLNYEIDCYNRKARKAVISGDTPGKEVQAFFSDYNRYGKIRVPASIRVVLSNNKGEFEAVIRNMETDWKGDIDFITGRNYRKVRIR